MVSRVVANVDRAVIVAGNDSPVVGGQNDSPDIAACQHTDPLPIRFAAVDSSVGGGEDQPRSSVPGREEMNQGTL